MQIGCFSERPFLFNEKFFLQKPLILLGLFNITKKKLKKSSEKLFTFKKVVYICIYQLRKTRIMKRFSKSKTYLDKDGNKYHYEGKYRGFYQFYKFLENRTAFKTYSERELLKLELTEK